MLTSPITLIMKSLRLPAISLAVICLGFLLFLASSASLLPDRMATHFGADGRANGWMSRSADLAFFAVLGIALPLFFALIGLATRVLPASCFNLPRRDYWLAPAQRPATANFILRQMLWFACLLDLLLAGIHGLTISANHLHPGHLPMGPFLTLLGAFLLATFLWAIRFIQHFARGANAS